MIHCESALQMSFYLSHICFETQLISTFFNMAMGKKVEIKRYAENLLLSQNLAVNKKFRVFTLTS